MEKQTVRIGNTSFDVKAVKAMGKTQFKKVYAPIIKNTDLGELYTQVVGSEDQTEES